ncbi:MAG TPA: thermonuclease family protein [Vicinamibacterales bacterium]|jgi:micrococcal nuclease
MQILRTVLIAAVAAVQLHGPARRSDPLLVTSVVDGNTIQLQTVGRVRLLGIQAPRVGRGLDTPPLGRQARDRLADLVLRRWVRLEQTGPDGSEPSRHGAYVWTEDGRLVNGVLVREGLARVSGSKGMSRLAELQALEAEARSHRRGLWAAERQ